MNAIPTRAESAAIAVRANDEEGAHEYVALRHLRLDERNVRKDPPTDAEVEELAGLIDAQGLLQNLAVVAYSEPVKGRGKGRSATHGVIAGGCRYRALMRLVERKRITLDDEILCRVVPESRALAVSAAENSGRKDISTADTVVAFADMVRAGAGVEELAVAFHLSPLTVQRRLKLANVSPKLFAMFRAGELTLDQLMALALTDDHEKQEAAWNAAPAYDRSARQLRSLIAGAGLSAAIVRFVGLPAYEEAGGQVLRDLFSEAEEAPAYVLEADLMMRMATEKLDAIAQGLRDEGVAWVETFLGYSYSERQQFITPPTQRKAPSAAQAKALEKLQAEAVELQSQLDVLYESDEDAEDDDGEDEDGADASADIRALEDKLSKVESRIRDIEGKLKVVPAELADKVGALVYIDGQGFPVIDRPVMRKADAAAARRSLAKAEGKGSGSAADSEGEPGDRSGLSDRLCHQLTAHRTRALQALMLQHSRAALAALVHPLLTRLVHGSGAIWTAPSNVKVSGEDCESQLKTWAPDLAEAPAELQVQQALAAARALLPAEADELLPWLLDQPEAVLTQLLTLCAALSLNVINGNGKPGSTAPLAAALGLKMTDWWSPTIASYLGSVSKAQIGQALQEAGMPEEAADVMKLKKVEAAAKAEELLAGKGWLPAVLRG